MTLDHSPIQQLADMIAAHPDALAIIDEAIASLTPVQLAHVRYNWALWARSKQIIPLGPWKSFGLLTGLGFGKTRAIAEFITAEVIAGRASSIGLCAQNEDKTYDVMVAGKSGLLAVSPWWFKARFELGRVVWPDGSEAFLYTPEAPGAMRGPEHHIVWVSELIAWPSATGEEALRNLQRRARLGYGKTVWDSNPMPRDPLIRYMLSRAEADPAQHLIVRGTTRENTDNLAEGYVDAQYAEYGGTKQGASELDGIYLDDADGAMFLQEWISKTRRDMPDKLLRRIIVVDPATTQPSAVQPKRRSDDTGITDMGLGVDKQVLAIANYTGVHRHEAWCAKVIDLYVTGRCDLIWIETNAGGTTWVALLRVAAEARGLTIVELGKEEKPGNRPDVVYVRPINSKGSKASRASGAAALLERGRVSFVAGGHGLARLEDRLCVFDGSERTPDNEVDAFVSGCHELAGIGLAAKPDNREALAATTAALTRMATGGRAAPVGVSTVNRLRGPWKGPSL